jgi:Ser-tRNA(Ala) deacylase AlaX
MEARSLLLNVLCKVVYHIQKSTLLMPRKKAAAQPNGELLAQADWQKRNSVMQKIQSFGLRRN